MQRPFPEIEAAGLRQTGLLDGKRIVAGREKRLFR